MGKCNPLVSCLKCAVMNSSINSSMDPSEHLPIHSILADNTMPICVWYLLLQGIFDCKEIGRIKRNQIYSNMPKMFRYVSCMMWMVSSIPNETRNSVLSSCPSLSSSPAQICFLLNAIAQIKDTEWGAGNIFEDGGDGWRVEGLKGWRVQDGTMSRQSLFVYV